ncbi:MAG: chemotaxis response regulator protein-glutamate methylesterase [Gammaproteobacteria bacterium]|nr:chemotaxis response regulator protein-glutamate methylesterase [Gammaproteobacteria bacterium]
MTVRVLIVDDSALVREMLSRILNEAEDIEVVGTAPDPFIARDKIKRLNPDVLTLDVEMPKMDGITFLGNLMRLRPMPVVMISSLTEKGASITLQAMELGAVDFVPKPKLDVSRGLEDYAELIIEKVRVASKARVRALSSRPKIQKALTADAILGKTNLGKHYRTTDQLIAVGASTGGTEAIREFMEVMPPNAPGIVITQHIPEAFSASFAERVNNACAMTVQEAVNGQQILPGHAYIAPGSHHLMVVRNGARYECKLSDGPPVNRHRPSVDVMFRSMATNVGPNGIAVLLTGMGEDGAAGMEEMRESGAYTFAQDEQSSVVWGMPGAAVARGCVDEEVSLDKMAVSVLKTVNTRAN